MLLILLGGIHAGLDIITGILIALLYIMSHFICSMVNLSACLFSAAVTRFAGRTGRMVAAAIGGTIHIATIVCITLAGTHAAI